MNSKVKSVIIVAVITLIGSLLKHCVLKNNDAVYEMERMVKQVNNDCPQELGMLGELTEAGYDRDANTIWCSYRIKPEFFDISAAKENPQLFAEMVKLTMCEKKSEPMVKVIEDAGASIELRFTKGASLDMVTIELSSDDVKSISKMKLTDSQRAAKYLDIAVLTTNLHLPMEVDEMTMLDTVYISGQNYVYSYVLDEEQITVEDLETAAAELKSEAAAFFIDRSSRVLVRNLICADMTLVYRYKGSESGDSLEITYSPVELKEFEL